MKLRAIMVVTHDSLLHELRFRGNFHGEEKLAVSSRPDDEEKSSEDGEAEEEKKRRRQEKKRRQENKSPVSSSKRKTCQTFRLEGDVEQYKEIATRSATKVGKR